MPARRGLLIDVCWQTRECTTNNHVLQTDESCLMPLTLIAVQKIVEIDLVEALETTVPCFWNREISVSRHISIVLPKMAARDSARDNAMYEAENDQLISKLIELERATSALRLVQTLVVLLERLIPLLEEIRAISRNSLAVIAMLKDNLLNVEAELQQRSCEVREQILARYHRALRGWREQ